MTLLKASLAQQKIAANSSSRLDTTPQQWYDATMIFQTLDDKETCVASYYNGGLHFDHVPQEGTATWNYHTYLPEEVEVAELYLGGAPIEKVVPQELVTRWEEENTRLKAMLKSFYHVGLTIDDFCFYELVPHRFLKSHSEAKNKTTEWVIKNVPKPTNYDQLIRVQRLVKNISKQPVKLNPSNIKLQLATKEGREQYQRWKNNRYIVYNPFGTRTGRLSTAENSFPILLLPKKMRGVVEPYRNVFLEFDVVSAEVATLFYLTGKPIPEGDLHQWFSENVFGNKYDRDEVKKKFFAWLYDPKKQNKQLENLFSRQEILAAYYDGEKVTNPMGRTIYVDEERALNYLVQSTFNDIFIKNIAKLEDKMKEWGMKSNISFIIHDSVTLDFDAREKNKINDIMEVLSQHEGFKFNLHLNMGKNYGDMRQVL